MLQKRIKLLFCILFSILLLSGCWDSRDVEDKDISTSVTVDKTEDGYKFYVTIASINKQSSGGESSQGADLKTSLVIAEGKTFVETRENLDRMTNEVLYLEATQVVFLTEKLAYSGIEEYLIRLRQTPEYRKTLDVVVMKAKPEDFLNFQPENAPAPGFAVESTIQSLIDTGQSFHLSLGDILGIIVSANKGYLLHTVDLKDQIEVVGYSAFDNGKCVGFIPFEEAKGIILFMSNNPRPNYVVPHKDGSMSISIRKVDKSITPSFKDNKISFDIRFNIGALLIHTEKNIKITEDIKNEITESLGKQILEDIYSTLKTSQNLSCDFLGFYNDFRIAYPEEVKHIDWKQQYPQAEFNIQVKAELELVSTVNYHSESFSK